MFKTVEFEKDSYSVVFEKWENPLLIEVGLLHKAVAEAHAELLNIAVSNVRLQFHRIFPINCCQCSIDLDEEGCSFQYGSSDCLCMINQSKEE